MAWDIRGSRVSCAERQAASASQSNQGFVWGGVSRAVGAPSWIAAIPLREFLNPFMLALPRTTFEHIAIFLTVFVSLGLLLEWSGLSTDHKRPRTDQGVLWRLESPKDASVPPIAVATHQRQKWQRRQVEATAPPRQAPGSLGLMLYKYLLKLRSTLLLLVLFLPALHVPMQSLHFPVEDVNLLQAHQSIQTRSSELTWPWGLTRTLRSQPTLDVNP